MSKSATKIAVLYSGVYFVEISIFIGALAGLPLRYFLEKHYIFSFQSKNIKHDGNLFILYSFIGLFTAAIFWGTEYAFHLIFTADVMCCLGGVLGLSIGYYIKYQLDKCFVFIDKFTKVVAI
jgi:hypothetical protein